MKTLLIAFIAFTTINNASAFTRIFKGEVPETCDTIFSTEYQNSGNPVRTEMGEALILAVHLTKSIMDLKFQTHAYLQDNLSLYVEYAKQMEMKKNLDQQKSEIEILKQKMIDDSDEKLASLLAVNSELASTMYSDYMRERKNELIIFNNRIFYIEKEWNKKKKAYYSTIRVWSPYENNLKNLEKVEKALQTTLRNLEELNRSTGTTFVEILTLLDGWRPEEADRVCARINQHLQEILK